MRLLGLLSVLHVIYVAHEWPFAKADPATDDVEPTAGEDGNAFEDELSSTAEESHDEPVSALSVDDVKELLSAYGGSVSAPPIEEDEVPAPPEPTTRAPKTRRPTSAPAIESDLLAAEGQEPPTMPMRKTTTTTMKVPVMEAAGGEPLVVPPEVIVRAEGGNGSVAEIDGNWGSSREAAVGGAPRETSSGYYGLILLTLVIIAGALIAIAVVYWVRSRDHFNAAFEDDA